MSVDDCTDAPPSPEQSWMCLDDCCRPVVDDSYMCGGEAIYGKHSQETELLRYIRDSVLAQSPEGREIIKLYYQWSPVIVQAMENDAAFKEEVKEMVDGVLELIE